MLFTVSLTAQTNYYVSTTGSDSNPGTINAPWATIQHAASTMTAGSTVYVREGTYNQYVTINHASGNATNGYITYQNYPGEHPILDATGLTPPSNAPAIFFIWDQNYIIIKGFEIRNFTTTTSGYTPAGIWVAGTCNHIQILNNHIHNIEHNGTSKTQTNAHGIAFYGESGTSSMNNIIIDSNEVDSCKLGSSESVVVNGNVEIFQITNNKVHDNNNIGIDAIGGEGTASANDQARNGIISNNLVYNIDSKDNVAYAGVQAADGIYVDGGTDIVIERNIVHNTNIGIELGCEHAGKMVSYVTMRNNFIYYSDVAGIAIGGYDQTVGSAQNCKILNNTLFYNDQNKQGDGEIMWQYDVINNQFYNNIFYANSQDLFIANDYTTTSGNTVDYNIYNSSTGSTSSQWEWNKVFYTGFSAYKTASGNDAHSFFVDPVLVSTSTPDLHIQQTSPAINAGEIVDSVGTLDIDGNPRVVNGKIDIGAQEWSNVIGINNKELLNLVNFELYQNYPNPFNPTTTIEFAIKETGIYNIKIFNILGQLIKVLSDKEYQPGNYKINFDASHLASGIYFYKLNGNNVNLIKKMILLK
jgi:hypothetical protein